MSGRILSSPRSAPDLAPVVVAHAHGLRTAAEFTDKGHHLLRGTSKIQEGSAS